MANKSGVSNQVISLPQGGGALQGIGEKFAPDLHTGTGNFTVPIAVPPGRGGLSPQLSLVYSTGNGNGPFGLGWSLSVPGVSRKTFRGIPKYDDARDTFVLSGAEDLVPVPGGSDGQQCYRPRVEGLFASIRRHRDGQNDYWEVRSKEGLRSLYGTPSTAGNDPGVVADPSARRKVFAWKLTETSDPFHNRIVYEYLRDLKTKDGQSGSRHWEDSYHEWDQIYIKRIRYADYVDQGETTFLISVAFVYEDRPDRFSDCRAGFEIRTRQRCTRIDVYTHHGGERLIRSYRLNYLDQQDGAEHLLPPNGVSLLSRISVIGYGDDRKPEELPPLDLAYTAFEPQRRRYQPLSASGNAMPERALAHPEYELVDLFGNGLPDIIQLNHTVARYWRNRGGGVFDLPRNMASRPAGVSLADAGVQMADLNGDGRADLLVTDGVRGGCYPLTFQGRWDQRIPYRPDRPAPTISLQDPDVRLMDLDGDGVVDALRSGLHFELYYGNPEKGWVKSEHRPRRALDELPNVNFSDPRVKLADMNGDGLLDIVLIHNGRVDYWPYLGYGRWGRRITMRNSPRFDDAAVYGATGYDPKRVLLGDVDGDGCADLVYVGSGHVTVWTNRSGNGWSRAVPIWGTPPITDTDAVRLADMLGTGTSGILWTYDYGTHRDSAYKFLDLTGGVKPYLLSRMDNHTGAITEIEYASSTECYLKDEVRPKTRWQTPLPFPVQVVARVTVTDAFSRGRLTTEYRYHHGYWDGIEREFRGFGMVEQLDTEVADHRSDDLQALVRGGHLSPPLLTKTWFHQGAIEDGAGGWKGTDFGAEFWPGDPQLLSRSGVTDLPTGLSAKRDALRALRGSILRTELYALDGGEREEAPYTVTESSYGLREEAAPAPGEGDRLRIFFPHALVQRTTQWERGDDPMTHVTFTDDHDEHGQPRQQTTVALPRRSLKRASVTGTVIGEIEVNEARILATHTRTQYAVPDPSPADPDLYIHDRVAQVRTFELAEPGGVVESSPDDLGRTLQDQAAEAEAIHRRFRDLLEGWRPGRRLPAGLRLLGHTLNRYDGRAFEGRDDAKVGPYGALTRSEALVFGQDELKDAYGNRRPVYLGGGGQLPSGAPAGFGGDLGYRAQQASAKGYHKGYYADTQRQRFDFQVSGSAQKRGLVVATQDPLGHQTTVTPDEYWLLPKVVRDPVGLETRAEYDYRVMQPRRVTDANGHRTHFLYTPLGLLKKQFLEGRDGEGGTEAKPEIEFEYDFLAYERTRHTKYPQPISVHTRRRVWHARADGATDETIEAREYSDGFGRLIQTRAQGEDLILGDPILGGAILPADQDEDGATRRPVVGRRRADSDPPNVVVSGWQTYDNKGRVIEKYEPFFSTGWDYRSPDEERDIFQREVLGQKATLYYDPRGQLIRTVNPGGSEQRVIFGRPEDPGDFEGLKQPDAFPPTPWESYTYDANDLAPLSRDPETDQSLEGRAPAAHRFTPTSAVVDALGRVVCQIERNGPTPASDWFVTRSAYDIRGNLLTVRDAHGRPAFRHAYDLLNRPLRVESIDAGLRTSVLDAAGNLVEYRDSKDSIALRRYDQLNRLTHLWARNDAAQRLTLRERLEYGDAQPDRDAQRDANRLGRLWRHYDEAGLLEFNGYDFKGNVAEKTRKVVSDEALGGNPSWTADWERATSGDDLDDTLYRTTIRYDALNRPVEITHPEDVAGNRAKLEPHYNRAGALERVDLDDQPYVTHLAYNAKGQRVLVAYGNGVMTRYAYDPRTFRLARLRSERYRYRNPASNEHEWRGTGAAIQDFTYGYDLVGNITSIEERTPNCGIAGSQDGRDRLRRTFEYDPLYRLTEATGRACKDIGVPRSFEDRPRCGFHSPGSSGAPNQDNAPDLTESYTESYRYDAVGNMAELRCRAGRQWTRTLAVEPGSNRLESVKQNGTTYHFKYDKNGNLLAQSTERQHTWGHADRLIAFRIQPAGRSPASKEARHLYGADGMRVKKWVRNGAGKVESTVYIDGTFEHHRWTEAGAPKQNNHVHVMDGQQRVALVRRGPARADDVGPVVQYRLGDHLDSSHMVVGDTGAWINREEYFPYGDTSFGSFAFKRYRFTGKERDEESGFSYHGARHYAPWLGRWISPDPLLFVDGLNSYSYVNNQSATLVDPEGRSSENPNELAVKTSALEYSSDHLEARALGGFKTDPNNLGLTLLDENIRKSDDLWPGGKLPAEQQPISLFEAMQRGPQDFRSAVAEMLGGRRYSEVMELNELWNEALKIGGGEYGESNKAFKKLIATQESQAAWAVRKAFAEAGVDILERGDSYFFRLREDSFLRAEGWVARQEAKFAEFVRKAGRGPAGRFITRALKAAPAVGMYFGVRAAEAEAAAGRYDRAVLELAAVACDPIDYALLAHDAADLAAQEVYVPFWTKAVQFFGSFYPAPIYDYMFR